VNKNNWFTIVQPQFYYCAALKKKIRIEDLLSTSSASNQSNVTSNLMNLVMQFRKVCNHPDLFERQEPKTPLLFESPVCQAPRLIYDMEYFQRLNCGAPNEVKKMFSIFSAANVHRSSLGKKVNTYACWYHSCVFCRREFTIDIFNYEIARVDSSGYSRSE
jgi:SNF2 family DNA or RNA helicase